MVMALRPRSLRPHPRSPARAVRAVHVSMRTGDQGALRLEFDLDAHVQALLMPPPCPGGFADGLWRHTCFELFAARSDGAYREFNFSPSSQYAIYDFVHYRAGMSALNAAERPSIRVLDGGLSVHVEVPIGLLRVGHEPFRDLGVAAIIEEHDGALSFWALHHPREEPDFHHRDGFIVRWPPAAGTEEQES